MTNELLISAALLALVVLSRVRDKRCEQTHSTQSLVLNTVVCEINLWYYGNRKQQTSSKVWFPQRISISSTNNLKEEEEEEQEEEVLFV